MTVKSANYKANLQASTVRGPSPAIWANCPTLAIIEDPALGFYFYEDWTMAGQAVMSSAYKDSIGRWATYADAGSIIVPNAGDGVSFGADGDNEETSLFSNAGNFRLVTTSTLALNGKLWFEASVARSSVTATKGDFFVGLAEPLLASNISAANLIWSATDNTLVTTKSFIGFISKGNAPTEWQFVFNLASGTANIVTNMTTLMASSGNSVLTDGAFARLGFLFDPNADTGLVSAATARQTAGQTKRKMLRVFVNNLELPAFLSADDIQNATAGQAFPTGWMGPTMSVMNQTGSTPPTMGCRFIRAAQLL